MMDLKEIIRWFIPCFHIMLAKYPKINSYLTLMFLFLLFNLCPSSGADVNSVEISDHVMNTKNRVNLNYLDNNRNQSDYGGIITVKDEGKSFATTPIGRTFGRPLKKMMQALIPLAFQIGAASTWAVVAALVGVKTLAVALLILKLLLIAGAAKVGAVFGQKTHHGGWEQQHPQKEIHLHIHNGQHGATEEHYPLSGWSREGTTVTADTKPPNVVVNPYAAGPQTINTPYGNYVRVEPPNSIRK